MRTEKGVNMVELTLRDGRKTAIRASFVVKAVSEVVGGQGCTRLEILGAPYSTYVVEPYEEVVDLVRCYGKN